MNTCVFCDIIAGDEPASIVYQDDLVIAFLDIRPVNPGHTLVLPKEHYPYLDSIDAQTAAHLFTITTRIAHAIRHSDAHCEGINLFLADGEAAFQEVFHLHMHVIPRFKGDHFKISADWDAHPPRQELDLMAKNIRDAYQR
jgi:histidine triad (HIT) family protein